MYGVRTRVEPEYTDIERYVPAVAPGRVNCGTSIRTADPATPFRASSAGQPTYCAAFGQWREAHSCGLSREVGPSHSIFSAVCRGSFSHAHTRSEKREERRLLGVLCQFRDERNLSLSPPPPASSPGYTSLSSQTRPLPLPHDLLLFLRNDDASAVAIAFRTCIARDAVLWDFASLVRALMCAAET
jgi:hypothetical protein